MQKLTQTKQTFYPKNLWILAMLMFTVYLMNGSAFAVQVHDAKAVRTTTQVKENGEPKKVLIVVSSDKRGYWLPEVLEPFQLLQQSGFDVDIASPKGGSGTARGSFQLSSKQVAWFDNSVLNKKLALSIPLSTIETDNYVAVYFAGGAGPMFDLVNDEGAQKVTREIYESGGFVAADCHGPAALLNVKLSNGQRLIADKNVTGKANVEEGRWARNNYPFLLEDKLAGVGGIYSAKAKGQAHVVVDQRIITGQNPASAVPMTEKLIEQLLNL